MPGFELIGEEEKSAVMEVFEEGGVFFAHGFQGLRKKYHVREFELHCSEYFKVKYCLAVSSGTAGVKIALKALGVEAGDEVITQAHNFIGVVEAIMDCGALPVIVNVDETFNMDPLALERRITKKTKAILPVHMLGGSASLSEIKEIACKHQIPILEDACEAIGASYGGRYLGTIGDVGVLSFDQGKMIAMGEGGLIMTNNPKIAKFCREYHDHGHENNPTLPRGRDTRSLCGFNYRLTELQAAIGKVQLKKLSYMLAENKKRYMSLYMPIVNKFKVRKLPANSTSSFDTFILTVDDDLIRNKIIKVLADCNFGTKNIPDAMEWHCSGFWGHLLTKEEVKISNVTVNLLEKSVAIPILLKRSVEDYEFLAERICLLSDTIKG